MNFTCNFLQYDNNNLKYIFYYEVQLKNILLIDSEKDRDSIRTLLPEYNTVCADSAFDATVLLSSEKFDLVITEIDLPGDNSFELYYYIKNNYQDIPVVMLTNKNIDSFFDKIFIEGIPNILHKPVSQNELKTLVEKLTNKNNIFGLKNYLENISEHKQIKITESSKIQTSIDSVIKYLVEWGFNTNGITILNLILNEIIINAVYHSHGFTDEKLKRLPVILPENKHVLLSFAHNQSHAGISITDFNGKLSKCTILENMFNAVNQKKLLEKALHTGEDISNLLSESGRGIDLVRQLAGEYYFILSPDEKTEVIILFPFNHEFTEYDYSSLKIIEK